MVSNKKHKDGAPQTLAKHTHLDSCNSEEVVKTVKVAISSLPKPQLTSVKGFLWVTIGVMWKAPIFCQIKPLWYGYCTHVIIWTNIALIFSNNNCVQDVY